jgi:hypothetical protein
MKTKEEQIIEKQLMDFIEWKDKTDVVFCPNHFKPKNHREYIKKY